MDRGTKIGRAFKAMKGTCPLEMGMYSKCVLAHSGTDSLEKNACSKEFEALRKCFRKTKPGLR
jgi:hypothetical protein